MERQRICIYCKQDDPARFKGVEHVVPQAFGTFGSQTPTLNCVCDDCNGHFGKNHDAYLARETIEGITRYKRRRFSSEARPQKHLEITLEAGPEAGEFGGMKVALDGTTGELMRPKAQFIVVNQKTGKPETYFKHQIAGLQLPEDVYGGPGDGKEIKSTWSCRILAFTKDEHDDFVECLRANGINYVSGEPFRMPEPGTPDNDGKFTLPVEIKGEIGLDHRMAHAKILLNFIAKYLECEEALKPEWDALRRYARYGEGAIKYTVIDPPPPEKDDELRRLVAESIVIRLENLRGNICGILRFYGNHTYAYVVQENASLPDERIFGWMFTVGLEPQLLMQGKNLARLLASPDGGRR